MTNAQFRRTASKVHKLAKLWKHRLGLSEWNLTVEVMSDVIMMCDDDSVSNWKTTASSDAKWEYLQGTLRVSAPAVAQLSDETLEEVVVHELLHCVVSEMRSDEDEVAHEERVVSSLTSSFTGLIKNCNHVKPDRLPTKGGCS